jgi:hypothetical protein
MAATSSTSKPCLTSCGKHFSDRCVIDGTLPSCYSFTICNNLTTSLHHFEPLLLSLQHLLSELDLLDRSITHTVEASTPSTDTKLKSSPSFENDAIGRRGEIMNNIGYVYLHGLLGTPRDPIKAVEWFKKSALLEDQFGWFNYGFMLRDGVSNVRLS